MDKNKRPAFKWGNNFETPILLANKTLSFKMYPIVKVHSYLFPLVIVMSASSVCTLVQHAVKFRRPPQVIIKSQALICFNYRARNRLFLSENINWKEKKSKQSWWLYPICNPINWFAISSNPILFLAIWVISSPLDCALLRLFSRNWQKTRMPGFHLLISNWTLIFFITLRVSSVMR